MTETLVDYFSSLSYNLVIEGTLRTSEVPLASATLLCERGYDVSLALMAVKPEISLVSCQLRYEQMRISGTTPRATDPAHHRKIVDQIVSNLAVLEESGMFDGIYLYNRDRVRLYPQDGLDLPASQVLEDVLFGNWTEAELGSLPRAQVRARGATAQGLMCPLWLHQHDGLAVGSDLLGNPVEARHYVDVLWACIHAGLASDALARHGLAAVEAYDEAELVVCLVGVIEVDVVVQRLDRA